MTITLPDDEQILSELDIHPESFSSFEDDLKNASKVQYRYSRLCAQAQKLVDSMYFELEILTGNILKEILASKKVPASAISEIRRTEVPLDKRFIELKTKLIDATELLNVLQGVVKSLESRSYRLGDLAELKKKLLKDDFTVYEDRDLMSKIKNVEAQNCQPPLLD